MMSPDCIRGRSEAGGRQGRQPDAARWGRRSSPLDAIRSTRWTAQSRRELLELLWVLRATLERWSALAELPAAVLPAESEAWDQARRGVYTRISLAA